MKEAVMHTLGALLGIISAALLLVFMAVIVTSVLG